MVVAESLKMNDRQDAATQAELTRFQHEVDSRMGRVERQGDRMEVKVDALLSRLNIPNPAPYPGPTPTPPMPTDAGKP